MPNHEGAESSFPKTGLMAALVIPALAVSLVWAGPQRDQHPLEQMEQHNFDLAAVRSVPAPTTAPSGCSNVAAGSSVDVKVIREVRERYEDDAQQILSEHQVNVSQSGNDIIVTTEVSDRARDRWNDEYRNTRLRVRFEISVPRDYNVDLETAGGNIKVDDLNGDLRSETAGGNLDFGNISGTIWAHTAGGNITLEGSSGSADVSTSGGNITIGDVDGDVDAETSGGSIRIERAGGEVHASTAGGNIEVREVGGTIKATTSGGNVSATITRQPAGDCRLSTSAGTVTVTLAEGIAVDVDARTSIGGVSSDFSIDGTVGRNSIRGSINGGGPELHLRTSAGSIRIRRS